MLISFSFLLIFLTRRENMFDEEEQMMQCQSLTSWEYFLLISLLRIVVDHVRDWFSSYHTILHRVDRQMIIVSFH